MEQRKNFVINFFYFMIAALIFYFVLKFAVAWLLPFLIGFAIALILKRPINWISAKTHIKRRPVACSMSLLFFCTIGVLIALLCIKLVAATKDLFYLLPDFYRADVEPAIRLLLLNVEGFISRLDPSLVNNLHSLVESLTQSLGSLITRASSVAISALSGFATSIPAFLIGIIISIIATFFLSMDYYKVTGFILRQLSPKAQQIVFAVKKNISQTIFQFIKAYGILMLITFIELSIGLSILRVPNAIAIAALIAVVDIFPVLGTGGVVIPWAIISFAVGNIPMGIGLLIIYAVITVVRNILEPKIVGEQVGLPPLAMLVCMFIGAKLFGVLGIFILPISMTILKNLNDSGEIHIFK